MIGEAKRAVSTSIQRSINAFNQQHQIRVDHLLYPFDSLGSESKPNSDSKENTLTVGRKLSEAFDQMDAAEDGHGVHLVPVANAGLILLAPFMQRFFNALDIQHSKGRIELRHHNLAAAVLYKAANGSEEPGEYQLGLIKILLGLTLETPIALAPIALSPDHNEEIDALLRSVINHWNAIGRTSVTGFRESFLNRRGLLGQQEQSWTLHIERQGADVLLDRLPWNISLIKLPWMPKPITVTW